MAYDPYHIPGLDRWLTTEPEDPNAEAYEHFSDEANRMGFDELVAELGEEPENLIEQYETKENAVEALRDIWIEQKIDALNEPPDYDGDFEPDDYD